MRIVTLTRDMRPWRKDQDAVLPDELAEKLIQAGEALNSRPYPPKDVAPAESSEDAPEAPPNGKTPPLKGARPYFTRKRGST